MKNLYREEGRWYKGNLHMHTTLSDGEVSPEQAIAQYKSAGYDFLALTDHWFESETAMDGDMLLLSGCEWDTGNMVQNPIYHILGIGMQTKTGLKKSNTIEPQKLIDSIRKAGGIAILAHPAWSLTDPEAASNLTGLAGAEIFNTISNADFRNGRRADSSVYFDYWANKGNYMGCFAGDDSHFYIGEQTQSFVMVKAKELTRNSIIEALKNGQFYGSQGPEILAIEKEDNIVKVNCEGAEKVIFYSNTVWCHDRSQVISGGYAEYEIKKTDKFVRVELIDKNGKMAWSAPFPV